MEHKLKNAPKRLDLRLCQIFVVIPGAFKSQGHVEKLDLSENKLSSLPGEAFKGLTGTKELDLSKNLLVSVSADAFTGLNSLMDLYLVGNQLLDLPDGGFRGLPKIKNLYLAYNSLLEVRGPEFSNLGRSIKRLDLEGSKINAIRNDCFKQLQNLETLNLKSNTLAVVRRGPFSGMHNLKFLDLSGCSLIGMQGKSFEDLQSLRQLDLSRNKLTRLPPNAFKGLSSLHELDLSGNKLLGLLPDVFQGVPSLKKLVLASNFLPNISPGTFNKLKKLQYLNLKNNLLKKLDVGLLNNNLTSLQKLLLNSNLLKVLFPKTFRGLRDLKHLDLSNNRITYAAASAFRGLRSLRTLDMKRNAFICGCRLTRLIRQLEALSFTEDVIGSCTNKVRSVTLYKNLNETCDCGSGSTLIGATARKKDHYVSNTIRKVGNIKPLIFGGKPVPRFEFPWHVTVSPCQRNEYGEIECRVCGGTLIDEFWVLTAAHCVPNVANVKIQVRASNETFESRFGELRILIHEAYPSSRPLYDIGLIKIQGHTAFNQNITACLPDVDRETIWTHSIGYVSGNGMTTAKNPTSSEQLQYTKVEIVNQTTCNAWYPGSFNEQLLFCAGGNGHDVCPGDSGGGLIVRDVASKRSVVEGIVSFARNGEVCKNQTRGSAFVRVNTFNDWIEEQIFKDLE